jgi:hypothetical protein
MMAFIHPRLRKPLGNLLAGTIFAAAWAVRGGPAWFLSIVIEISVLIRAVTLYVRAGEDSDEGALRGSRADERQKLIALRAWALAGQAAVAAAFIGVTIAVAVRSPAWWPFVLVIVAAAFGYVGGVSVYRMPDDEPADEAGISAATGSPVSS